MRSFSQYQGRLRLLCTSTPTPPPLSGGAAKNLIRGELDPDRALTLLSSLDSSNYSSYNYFVCLVAQRLSRCHRLEDAVALLDSRLPLATVEPDFASLLTSYGSASIPDRGLSAFEARIADSSLTVSVLSFNALLSCFLRSSCHHQAPHLFASLSQKHRMLFSPDVVSYSILIKSLCLSRKTGDALVVLKQMREEKGISVSPNAAIYTTILDSLYQENDPEKAEELWNEMIQAGCKPDNSAYNVRILYHALRAEADKVLELIKEMEAAGVKPRTITYNSLITCHFKNENVKEAKKVYKEMVVKKVCLPNAATFRVMLDGLCQGGDFQSGLELFRSSLNKNKVPDFNTVRMFVEGLVKAGKADRAKAVVAEVRKRFPANLTSRWSKVEKDLGLVLDQDTALPAQNVAS